MRTRFHHSLCGVMGWLHIEEQRQIEKKHIEKKNSIHSVVVGAEGYLTSKNNQELLFPFVSNLRHFSASLSIFKSVFVTTILRHMRKLPLKLPLKNHNTK